MNTEQSSSFSELCTSTLSMYVFLPDNIVPNFFFSPFQIKIFLHHTHEIFSLRLKSFCNPTESQHPLLLYFLPFKSISPSIALLYFLPCPGYVVILITKCTRLEVTTEVIWSNLTAETGSSYGSLYWTVSRWFLNISNEGHSRPFLGNLFQCMVTHMVKKISSYSDGISCASVPAFCLLSYCSAP